MMQLIDTTPFSTILQLLTTFFAGWEDSNIVLQANLLAAGDAHMRRFNDILASFLRKVKIVVGCLLYDYNIKYSPYHGWNLLELCVKRGITVIVDKFPQEFAGNIFKYLPNRCCII